MCVGPHLTYTKTLKAFKITQQSGAYWKNDKNNKMLTRINGIAFRTQAELDEHLKLMEEAEKRDHRKLGKETAAVYAAATRAPASRSSCPRAWCSKTR